MFRSFTDRVLGGVCGGLAAALRLSPWLVRVAFAILTIASLGAFAVLYVLLWWLIPQESLALRRRHGAALPLVLLLIVVAIAAWVGRDMGYLRTVSGVDLFWPGALLVLSAVFFLRQVRL